jgi:photosystem II stability/assembly factor-like uncharacterized protein
MRQRTALLLGLGGVGFILAACGSGSPAGHGSSSSQQEKDEAGAEGGSGTASGTEAGSGSQDAEGDSGTEPEASSPGDSNDTTPDTGEEEDSGSGSGTDGSGGGGGKPAPGGWMALVAGSGIFGQAYDHIPWSTSVVASVDLFAVSCVTNVSGWVAGAGGYVAHTADGGWSFSIQTTPFTSDLRAINFASDTLGVVAGDGGSLALTPDGGLHWVAEPSATTAALRGAVIALGANTIVVVGDAASLVVSNDLGVTWHTSTILGAKNLHGVTADTAAKLVLAVDDAGQIWSSADAASSFTLVATAPQALDAVALSQDDSVAVAVGAGGTAWARFGTGSFAPLTTGTTANLHAAIVDTKKPALYVAGDNGTLRESVDDGAHFSSVALAIATPIYALDHL